MEVITTIPPLEGGAGQQAFGPHPNYYAGGMGSAAGAMAVQCTVGSSNNKQQRLHGATSQS